MSYIIGIINEIISREIWKKLRNNTILIINQVQKITKEIDKPNLYLPKIIENKENKATWFTMIKPFCVYFIILCITMNSIDFYNKGCVIGHLITTIFFVGIEVLLIKQNGEKQNSDTESNIIRDFYYEAYYYALKNNNNSPIPKIEGQIAFMENMFIPISMFIVLPLSKYSDCFGYPILFQSDYFFLGIKFEPT